MPAPPPPFHHCFRGNSQRSFSGGGSGTAGHPLTAKQNFFRGVTLQGLKIIIIKNMRGEAVCLSPFLVPADKAAFQFFRHGPAGNMSHLPHAPKSAEKAIPLPPFPWCTSQGLHPVNLAIHSLRSRSVSCCFPHGACRKTDGPAFLPQTKSEPFWQRKIRCMKIK